MSRILFVVRSFAELGLFGQLRPLLHGLDHSEFELHVVATSDEPANCLKAHDAVAFYGTGQSPRSLQNWRTLRDLIQHINPNIIHAWGNATHRPLLLADIGNRSTRFFSHFCHPENAGWLQDLGLQRLKRRNDAHIYSHWKLVDQDVRTAQPQVIANSISTAGVDRPAARQSLMQKIGKQNQSVFLAGTVASMAYNHRLKDLVWAIDLLCCVRDDIHLLIFGYGDTKPLRRFIRKTMAGDNVHLFDISDARGSEICGIDFYWNSQRQIPNPGIMINCMANAIPVISVLDDETADLIHPLSTGLATNFGARDEFARWTKYLIEQPHAAERLKIQGQAHVEKLFPTQTMVDSYVQLYREG